MIGCAALLLASSVVASSGGEEPVAYAGKYAGEAPFAAQLARLPELQRAALAKVKARLGLEPANAARIRVEVRDALPAEPETLAPTKELPFATFTDGKGPDAPIVIRLHAEAIRSGDYDLGEELAHEMVHAVMRERTDDATYAVIPKWLREGLALWAAEQGPTRVAWILSQRAMVDGGWTRCYPGLGTGEHDLDRYVEDFRAIDLVEREKGAAAVAALAKLLVDGKPPSDAVEQASGRPYAKFVEDVKMHGLATCLVHLPEAWEDYADVSKLDRERKYAEVIAAVTHFEKLFPKSLALGDMLYFRGKAERLTSKPDAAVKTLSRLVGVGRVPTHYRDEALYQLARIQIDRRRSADALPALESILRDFPDSSLFEPASYWLAVALANVQRTDEARRWLDRFERSFPKSELAADAAKLRKRLR